jgi:hypothetical protein
VYTTMSPKIPKQYCTYSREQRWCVYYNVSEDSEAVLYILTGTKRKKKDTQFYSFFFLFQVMYLVKQAIVVLSFSIFYSN